LLDADEGLALIEHAGQCENCRAALLQADLHKKLLAAAAKAEFSGVRFEEPDPARLAEPAKRRPARPFAWKAWAIAAGILLALTAIGVPTGSYVAGFVGAQKELQAARTRFNQVLQDERRLRDDHDKEIVAAERALRTAEALRVQLEKEQEKEVRDAADKVFLQDLDLVVMGPAALRLDEPTTYTIETRKLNTANLAPAKLDVIVRDEGTNQVVWQQKDIKSTGRYQLVLGPDVAIKGGSGLALELTCSSETGARGELREKLALARATYVTHLTTDKPLYQPGEVVRWRSLSLDRFTLRPATDDLVLIYTLFNPQGNRIGDPIVHSPRVFGPDNKEILGPDSRPVRGIGTGQWAIPQDFPGGEYVLEVREARDRFPAEKRKFVVNEYQKHRLLKEVKFDKESYGPGNEVVANVKVEKAEGGASLAFMPVTAIVRIDGEMYTAAGQQTKDEDAATILVKTDDEGRAAIKFKLPTSIERGEATLGLTFTDGANREPMSRPIPVVVKKLQLELFPEGGDLVAGVPNRVYFQARTMLDKPAAVKGQVIDEAGKVVTDGIVTLNDPKEPGINHGNGLFRFTPQAGKSYQFQVTDPPGIEKTFPLPTVQPAGVTLSVPSGVTREGEPIQATVYSVDKDRELLVGVYCRGRLLNYQELTARAGQKTDLNLKPARDIGGVYRVTVFEKLPPAAEGRPQLKPVAERLVYREPAERLKIAATPEKRVYVPGEYVRLSLQTDSETGKPAPAIVLVGIVDKSVLKMADERTARSMPTHFLLTSEVRRPEDLEFTDVLLSDHALAREALDLLLGTQGWRRFLESDPKRFQDKGQQQRFEEMKCKADADRLFIALGKMKVDQNVAMNTFELQHKRIIDKYGPKFEDAQGQYLAARDRWQEVHEGREFEAKKRELHELANSSRVGLLTASAKLRDYEDFHAALRSRALLLFGIILLIAGAGSLVIAITRSLPRALPFYGSAVAAVAVCGLVVLGTFFFDTQMPEQATVALGSTPRTAELDAPQQENAPGGGFWQRPVDALADKPAEGADGLLRRADEARRGAMPLLDAKPDAKAAVQGDGKGGEEKGKGDAGGFGLPLPGQAGQPNPGFAPGKLEQQQREQTARDKKNQLALPAGAMPPALGARMPVPKSAPPARDGRVPGPVATGAPKPGDPKMPHAAFAGPGAPPGRELKEEAGERRNRAKDRLEDDRAALANGALRQRALQYQALGNNAEALKKLAKDADRAKGEAVANALEKARKQLAEAEMAAAAAAPCMLREYAHRRLVGPDPDLRWDFTETLYWHPVVVLPNGKGEVEFQLGDSVTSYQVVVFGHTTDGRLGAFTGEFQAKKLFNLSGTVPIEVTANDALEMPVAVENATDDQRTVSLSVEVQGMVLLPGTASNADRKLELQPKERTRALFRMQPTIKEGTAIVKIKGHTEPFGNDAVLYTIRVVPEGFPTTDQVSDVLEKTAQHEIVLPEQLIKGTLKASLAVYPSTLADLQKGLEGLLREPHGCFEQTSTTNYPNVLILRYLQESRQGNPEVEAKARGLLQRGYGKLIAFECLNQGKQLREGYEWFGGTAPAHEALTAYGLLQFRDMQRIGFPVDQKMIDRTRTWLLSRRDGKGGFLRNRRALDTFGRAPDHITNAYIVWAITEAEADGAKEDLDKEIDALITQAKDSTDPYFIALVANSLVNRDMKPQAVELLRKLTTMQKPEGPIDGAQTSITNSGGRTLQIETTALAVLAWTKINMPQDFHKNVSTAVKWIGQQRGGHGAFGSTQSTILALRALIVSLGKRQQLGAGELVLKVNNQEVARRTFAAGIQEAMTLDVPEAEKYLKAGKNDVRIELQAANQGGVLPYTFRCEYNSLKPVGVEQAPIRMAAKFSKTTAQDGDTVGLRVTVENTTKKGQGMVVAIVGLPAGVNLPENLEQLRNHARLRNNGTEPGLISAFEVRGRELILYWRQMAPKQKIEVDIDLTCRVPGDYRGPASRAYLYYNADHKHWIEPVVMKVEPK
jgi:hypothetical protein